MRLYSVDAESLFGTGVIEDSNGNAARQHIVDHPLEGFHIVTDLTNNKAISGNWGDDHV